MIVRKVFQCSHWPGHIQHRLSKLLRAIPTPVHPLPMLSCESVCSFDIPFWGFRVAMVLRKKNRFACWLPRYFSLAKAGGSTAVWHFAPSPTVDETFLFGDGFSDFLLTHRCDKNEAVRERKGGWGTGWRTSLLFGPWLRATCYVLRTMHSGMKHFLPHHCSYEPRNLLHWQNHIFIFSKRVGEISRWMTRSFHPFCLLQTLVKKAKSSGLCPSPTRVWDFVVWSKQMINWSTVGSKHWPETNRQTLSGSGLTICYSGVLKVIISHHL